MDYTDLEPKLKSYFSGEENVIAVYWFGSTVKGKARKDSDLDLAVLFRSGMNELQRFDAKLRMMNNLEEQLKTRIDLVDLRSADLFFIHQMMRDKRLVFEGDRHDRVTFEVRNRKDFFDRQPFYELYHHQARKRLRERFLHD